VILVRSKKYRERFRGTKTSEMNKQFTAELQGYLKNSVWPASPAWWRQWLRCVDLGMFVLGANRSAHRDSRRGGISTRCWQLVGGRGNSYRQRRRGRRRRAVLHAEEDEGTGLLPRFPKNMNRYVARLVWAA
jgi:hypothetical protein